MEQETKTGSLKEECGSKEEAFTHLAQGKRHLLVKDYNEAVTSLAMACSLLANLYGDFANECGEAYFNYGKALLELARCETGVLGIDCEREDSNESEGDDADEEGEDEKDGNATEGTNDENGKSEESEEKCSETDPNSCETNGKANDTDEKDKSTEDEDVDNLHLAWEMLEMAKIVFERQAEGNKQINQKLAEVYLKLGEVGLESENYSQGIEDINKCLEIQLQNLDEHDRCIAETHYQLGVAYTLNTEFDKAIEHYRQALKLLENRVEYLEEREKQGVTNAEQNESNPFYSIKEEIAEINALLPEVKDKISDVEDFKMKTKNPSLEVIGLEKDGSGEGSSEQGTSGSTAAFPFSSEIASDSKPVSNISHLVRKKRKLETDSSEEKSSKQLCPDKSKPE